MNLKRIPQQLQIPALTSASIEAGLTVTQPLDRQQFLWGLLVDFYGRLTTAGGAGAAVNAEAPLSIFRRVRVTQNHEVFGDKQRVNRSGASLARMYQILTGTAPVATGGLATANAAYDIHVQITVPLCLYGAGIPEAVSLATLCDAPRCGSLNLELDLCKGLDLVQSGGATTYAWSAFGGGGNPSIFVTLLQANGMKGNPKTAMLAQLDRLDAITSGTAIDNQLGNEIRVNGALARLWLKQYVADATSSTNTAATMLAPNTTGANGMSIPQFFVDARAIRQYPLWTVAEAENKQDYNLETWPSGYALMNFIEDGDVREVIPAVDMIKQGRKLGIGGLINGVANGQVESGYDLIYPR